MANRAMTAKLERARAQARDAAAIEFSKPSKRELRGECCSTAADTATGAARCAWVHRGVRLSKHLTLSSYHYRAGQVGTGGIETKPAPFAGGRHGMPAAEWCRIGWRRRRHGNSRRAVSKASWPLSRWRKRLAPSNPIIIPD